MSDIVKQEGIRDIITRQHDYVQVEQRVKTDIEQENKRFVVTSEDEEEEDDFLDEGTWKKKKEDERWRKLNFTFNYSWLSRVFMMDYLKLLLRSSKLIRLDGLLQLKHLPFLKPHERVGNNFDRF